MASKTVRAEVTRLNGLGFFVVLRGARVRVRHFKRDDVHDVPAVFLSDAATLQELAQRVKRMLRTREVTVEEVGES